MENINIKQISEDEQENDYCVIVNDIKYRINPMKAQVKLQVDQLLGLTDSLKSDVIKIIEEHRTSQASNMKNPKPEVIYVNLQESDNVYVFLHKPGEKTPDICEAKKFEDLINPKLQQIEQPTKDIPMNSLALHTSAPSNFDPEPPFMTPKTPRRIWVETKTQWCLRVTSWITFILLFIVFVGVIVYFGVFNDDDNSSN
ncbi:uncharacterized protein LOC126747904 [Anthonomus grandis grandis]|uniref:uncharacterized protein LOC126747904 n=1 Tax=Anthonomus grandis grandis TaxID=2921223 RepID=UPI002165460B|nr:uncharacterized protein LOC126747904 [Anthonomus grandis grandis]